MNELLSPNSARVAEVSVNHYLSLELQRAFMVIVSLVCISSAMSYSEEPTKPQGPALGKEDTSPAEVIHMLTNADLVVAGHFQNAVNDRHAAAKIRDPMVLFGNLRSNAVLVAVFSTTRLTLFVEPEAVWIFFLQKPYRVNAPLEYRRPVGGNYDYKGILPGSQENIRLVKQLVKQHLWVTKNGHRNSSEPIPKDLLAILESPETSADQKLDAMHRLHVESLPGNELIPVLAKLTEQRQLAPECLRLLTAIGSNAVPAVAQMLTNREEMIRVEAAAALGSLGPRGAAAIPDLLDCLKDPFFLVRACSAESLGKIGEQPVTVIPALTTSLNDNDGAVRQAAARALGSFGARAKEAIPALTRMLQGDTAGEARSALNLIQQRQ